MIVEPDQGGDTADPPSEYQLDVTDLVRSWLDGRAPNYGLAIAPVIDPSVDEGTLTRFQVLQLGVQPGAVHTEADGAGAAVTTRGASRASRMPALCIPNASYA